MRTSYPDATAEELYVLVHSDRMFRMPSLHLAAAHTAGGGRIHLCELTWPTPAAGGVFGACHSLDLPLVFGVFDQGLAIKLLGAPPAAGAAEVSAQMQLAWTTFARDGNPRWAPFDERRRATQIFDIGEHGGIQTYPEERSRQLWLNTPIEVIDLQR
jgi:para-nitrobenzyl esterase